MSEIPLEPIKVLICMNDPQYGIVVLATRPCKVIAIDVEGGSEYDLIPAKVVTEQEITDAHADFRELINVDPDFVEDWIYADELSSDEMRMLFQKRDYRTVVIDEEDQCGEDTAEFFRTRVAVGDECVLVTSRGWRIFRNKTDLKAFKEGK